MSVYQITYTKETKREQEELEASSYNIEDGLVTFYGTSAIVIPILSIDSYAISRIQLMTDTTERVRLV